MCLFKNKQRDNILKKHIYCTECGEPLEVVSHIDAYHPTTGLPDKYKCKLRCPSKDSSHDRFIWYEDNQGKVLQIGEISYSQDYGI